MLSLLAVVTVLQQPNLDGPELARPVSIQAKYLPVSEAVKLLDGATPAALAISPSISDLKVTIFVKDQPCGKVMEHIAGVLMCEWKAEKGGYRLIQDTLKASQAQAYLAAERNLLQTQAKKDLDEVLALTATPEAEDLAKLDALNKSGRPFRETAEERRALLQSVDSRKRLLGDLLRKMSPSEWSAFWKGQVMTAERAQPDKKPLRIAAAFDQTLNQLIFRTSIGPDGALMGLSYVVMPVPFLAPPEQLAHLPFAKEVLSWSTPKERIQAEKDLETSVDIGKLRQPGVAKSMSDYLELVHQQTGRPIVADGFRDSANFSAGKVSDIRSFILAASEYKNYGVRLEGPWILSRQGGFWQQRRYEAPEPAIRALEARAKKGSLTVDDYADFAAKLNVAQSMAFRIGLTPVVEFPTTPLRLSMPGFRFYGSLSRKQRESSFTAPLPFSNLTTSQRSLFCEALSSAVFTEGDRLSWDSGLLSGVIPPDLANSVAFSASKELVYPLGKPLPGGRNTGKQTGPSPNEKVPGAMFLFGLSPEKRVGYVVPVSAL